MIASGTLLRGVGAAALAFGLSAASTQAARATEFELTLSGVFNGTGADPMTSATETLTPTGGANLLTTANEAFTLTGIFNTSTGTLLPPPSTGFPSTGWVDYAPSSVTLTVGGTTYSVATYNNSIPVTGGPGLTVAIFDTSQVFGSGHYAAGFIQNPIEDGAGIVGDFLTATPGYTATNIVPTTYSDYFGVGFGNGVCTGGGGSGIGCTTTPIPLDGGAFELALGLYDLENPSNGVPLNPDGNPPNFANDNVFSASLTAVPEPSTWALLLAGFVGLGCLGLYRGRKTPLSA